ncbi:carbohydrate ABC transporter permease [Solicola sp. PLA-1-18]|uniref:carbohydrate ABC transporter permease n=1 Tax=Solicola sp. PLA-1-18 TaxID=3380532 RepID=UPI003B7A59DA
MSQDAAVRADVERQDERPPERSARTQGRLRRLHEAVTGYSFLAPNLVLVGVFLFLPLVWAVLISLRQTDGFTSDFVGLDNYRRLLSDPVFWRATANTALFTVIVVPLSMLVGLACAVLMNSVLPARGVFRTVVILPMAISGVATALMGVLFFDQNTGIANKLLGAVGVSTVPWQSGGSAAFVSVVLVTLWWRVGFNMLIYLAGLQGISPELYESARLDGAGPWQRFRFITLPMVGPSTFFLLVMNVIYSFQVFDIVFVMTQGGPGNATSVLVTYAYDTGFGETRQQGYAAAVGMVLLVLTLAFTALQWRFSRTRDLVE